jgi:hypothetical protein
MATNVGPHSLPCLQILEEGVTESEEHTSLLRQIINYGRKNFYSKSPRVTELGLLNWSVNLHFGIIS